MRITWDGLNISQKNDGWCCLLTEVELAVDFFTVDNVEPVLDLGLCVVDLEVEPLVVVVGVDVWAQQEVILMVTHLYGLTQVTTLKL